MPRDMAGGAPPPSKWRLAADAAELSLGRSADGPPTGVAMYEDGAATEYFSATHGQWLPATVATRVVADGAVVLYDVHVRIRARQGGGTVYL